MAYQCGFLFYYYFFLLFYFILFIYLFFEVAYFYVFAVRLHYQDQIYDMASHGQA